MAAQPNIVSVDAAVTNRDSIPLPMFNFPEDKPRTMSAAELIAILKYNNRRHEDVFGEVLKPKKTKEECVAEFLDLIVPDKNHKRVILRSWPRSPTGAVIRPTNSLRGKETPNGIQLWGQTMLDFFHVRRLPQTAGAITTTTGSKMLRWVKENGELDWAKEQIEWAENEEDPKIIEPYPMLDYIRQQEDDIRMRIVGEPMSEESEEDADLKDLSNPTFSPWPFVPFSYPTSPLQTLLPLHHLPEQIVVHDPWNLLAVNSSNHYGEAQRDEAGDWNEVKDRTYTYHLQLTPAGHRKVPQDVTRPVKADLDDLTRQSEALLSKGYMIPPTTLGRIPPPVFVVHDPPPCRPTGHSRADGPSVGLGHGPIEEAHLYLSPACYIGDGNHSVVYWAEWELPRSAVFGPADEPVLCKACIAVDVERILKAEDGESGERMEVKWREKRAEYRREVDVCKPEISLHVDGERGAAPTVAVADPGKLIYKYVFEGPVRPIKTTVGWQDPRHPTCEHLPRLPPAPPAVKVRVVAKLSKEGDGHLKTEADNYQKFDRHMFENWSGLNVVPPIHDPVPVGALVPQFYGYYTPPEADTEEKKGSQGRIRGYLSPILLMEDCGKYRSTSTLTMDEKNEVSSLLYRFHFAGWVHGSVYARNILWQYGPLNVPLSRRMIEEGKRTLSFRLIDFGRSHKRVEEDEEDESSSYSLKDWVEERNYEERAIDKLYGLRFWDAS